MDIRKGFWLFSTECYSIDLPARCSYIKPLKAKRNREAILVKSDKKIDIYRTKSLILVPKLEGTSFFRFNKEDTLFAYVIDGTNFISKSEIDLSKPKIVLDWGGISNSETIAKIWQVNIEDIQASKKQVHRYLKKE